MKRLNQCRPSVIMDSVSQCNSSVKSVEADSDTSTVIPEDIILTDDGSIAVPQIDSPAAVAEHLIVIDFNAFHILKTHSNLIIMNSIVLND